jgi:hypothetical protein
VVLGGDWLTVAGVFRAVVLPLVFAGVFGVVLRHGTEESAASTRSVIDPIARGCGSPDSPHVHTRLRMRTHAPRSRPNCWPFTLLRRPAFGICGLDREAAIFDRYGPSSLYLKAKEPFGQNRDRNEPSSEGSKFVYHLGNFTTLGKSSGSNARGRQERTASHSSKSQVIGGSSGQRHSVNASIRLSCRTTEVLRSHCPVDLHRRALVRTAGDTADGIGYTCCQDRTSQCCHKVMI